MPDCASELFVIKVESLIWYIKEMQDSVQNWIIPYTAAVFVSLKLLTLHTDLVTQNLFFSVNQSYELLYCKINVFVQLFSAKSITSMAVWTNK